MTMVVQDMKADDFVPHNKSPVTIEIGIGQVRGDAPKPTLPFDRANLVLGWARWEPALVAQQHREWFS